MTIRDIIDRKSPSLSVQENNAIPWDRTDFSERILKEHLSQEHDRASRKIELIKTHVDWIHAQILKGHYSKILDLCCGPGLYTNMLAKLGHHCKGIDFSPSAIEYAHITKLELMLDCEYILSDIRHIDYGREFDLAMMLFGDFNTKTKAEISSILKSANAALKEGGMLLLELFNFDIIEELGKRLPHWSSKMEGSFSSKPHLILKDYEWVRGDNFAVSRYFILHTENQKVEMYTEKLQAYSLREYDELFEKNGFSIMTKYPSIGNERDSTGLNLFGLLLKKTA